MYRHMQTVHSFFVVHCNHVVVFFFRQNLLWWFVSFVIHHTDHFLGFNLIWLLLSPNNDSYDQDQHSDYNSYDNANVHSSFSFDIFNQVLNFFYKGGLIIAVQRPVVAGSIFTAHGSLPVVDAIKLFGIWGSDSHVFAFAGSAFYFLVLFNVINLSHQCRFAVLAYRQLFSSIFAIIVALFSSIAREPPFTPLVFRPLRANERSLIVS